jgi:hypothetical protein
VGTAPVLAIIRDEPDAGLAALIACLQR